MKNIAFLEYGFMFDPTETFGNVYDFENKLSAFFKDQGYEAHVLTNVRGQTSPSVLFISKAKQDLMDKAEDNQNKKV